MKRNQFGLIGKNVYYSFSKKYFNEKFEELGIDCSYENYDLEKIEQFNDILTQNVKLKGLNVTIPYKESIIPYLTKLSQKAKKIGAVNTITISKNGQTKGYNTDFYGFKKSIRPLLMPHHRKALILGTGGAANAVAFALTQLDIKFTLVSRTPTENMLHYLQINADIFKECTIIINCSPVGTADLNSAPEIPYQYFTSDHIAFDLIYNPENTSFLSQASTHGAVTKNGYEMLVFQAEKSWSIWKR